jgi:hypothetical protein
MTMMARRAAVTAGLDQDARAVLWLSLLGLTVSLVLVSVLGFEPIG